MGWSSLSRARVRPAGGPGQRANQSRLVPKLCPTVESESFSWAWQGFSCSARRVTGPLHVIRGEQEATHGRASDHMPEGAGLAGPMWLCLCLPPRDHPPALT